MTAEEDALLNGIAAAPDDDVPRLVYADWLQDHDRDAFAEFIRIQCEIARIETGPRAIIDANVHLWRRQQELLDGYEVELLPPGYAELRTTPSKHRWHRGFLDELEWFNANYHHTPGYLAAMRPRPTSVRLAVTADRVRDLMQSDRASRDRITAIHLDSEPLDDETSLGCLVGDLWPRVTRLLIESDQINAVDQPLLGRFPTAFPALTQLVWTGGEVDDVVVFALLNSGFLHQLEVISFRHNAIEDQAALELADRLARSKKLRNLNLSNNPITRVGQSALLAAFGSRVDLF